MKGPRTTIWVYKFIQRFGISPLARHARWLVENEVDRNSALALIHELISVPVESFLVFDQLGVGQLRGVEVLVRKYQEIEEQVAKEEELCGTNPIARFYTGRPELPGGACICQGLQGWASKKPERRGIC